MTDILSCDSETKGRRRREGGRGYSTAANACEDSDSSGWLVTSGDFGECCGLKVKESAQAACSGQKSRKRTTIRSGVDRIARNLIVRKLEQRIQRPEAPGVDIKS